MGEGGNEPRITFETDGCVMGHVHNVTIAAWRTAATLELVTRYVQLSDEVGRVYPMVSTVHLIGGQVPVPSAESRAALDQLIARFRGRLSCVAAVLEGTVSSRARCAAS